MEKNISRDGCVSGKQHLEVNGFHARVIRRALSHWEETGMLSPEQRRILDANIKVGFNWSRLVFHFTWIAGCCFLISVGALFANKYIIELMMNTPDAVKAVFSFVLAGVFTGLGFWRKQNAPANIKTYAILLILGCLSIASGFTYTGKVFDFSEKSVELLLLLGCVIYGGIGCYAKSGLVWLFALVSFSGWLGSHTGYGYATYWIGVSEPFRFLIMGMVLTAASCIPQTGKYLEGRGLNSVTMVYGLLTLFTSLWFLSLFGGGGKSTDSELFFWAFVMGAASLGAVWAGIKYDRNMLVGFGTAFLGINLYTKYFEHFWDSLDKSVFFFILGLSLLAGIKLIQKFRMENRYELPEGKGKNEAGSAAVENNSEKKEYSADTAVSGRDDGCE